MSSKGMNLTKTCYKRDTFFQPILSNKFVDVLPVYFSEKCFPVFWAGMFFQFGAPREQASKPAKKQGRASKEASQQASKRRSKEAGKEETKSEAASKYVRKKIRENKNRRRKERKHRLQAWSEGPDVLDAACVVRDVLQIVLVLKYFGLIQ